MKLLTCKNYGDTDLKSIIQNDKSYCYIHRNYLGVDVNASQEHHCLHGFGRRKVADADGLTVYLCEKCHRLLHDKGFHDKDMEQLAEKTWLEHYNKSIEDFIQRYGRNYL